MPPSRRIFHSTVATVPKRGDTPHLEGKISVLLHLCKETRLWYDDRPRGYQRDGPRTTVDALVLLVHHEVVRQAVAAQLLIMSVPEEEVPAIIEKLVWKLSVVSDIPSHMHLLVLISDITVFFLGSAEYDNVSNWIARETGRYNGHRIRDDYQTQMAIEESRASYKPNFTPATRSFILGLKKLRFDSLEEAVVRETPTCAVCLQDFAESVEELITCLPCKHHFHVSCIVLCLEISHICPMCRYPMPTVEDPEPLTEATAN